MPTARQYSTPASGDTVTIGLKHPVGLKLQAYEMVEASEQSPSGMRSVKMARAVGDPFVINGSAVSIEQVQRGEMPPCLIVNGFAMTSGVPKELWDNWYSANRDGHLVRAGLIFLVKSESDFRNETKARRDVESGFEGIDPADPTKKTGLRNITTGMRT